MTETLANEITKMVAEMSPKVGSQSQSQLEADFIVAALDPSFGYVETILSGGYFLPLNIMDHAQDMGLLNTREYCNAILDDPSCKGMTRSEAMAEIKVVCERTAGSLGRWINTHRS